MDTNVFVAAGFKRESHSARIVGLIREGAWRLIWSDSTRREIEHVIGRIPVLSDDVLEGVFLEENCCKGKLDETPFTYILDPADRKFAALAVTAEVPLISSDDHLLAWRDRISVPVLTPGEFLGLRGRYMGDPG